MDLWKEPIYFEDDDLQYGTLEEIAQARGLYARPIEDESGHEADLNEDLGADQRDGSRRVHGSSRLRALRTP